MRHTHHQISILIPTYNDVCVELVASLSSEACQIEGLDYEILVADDGSTIADTIEANKKINSFPNCRYLIREQNVGRSAIRNFLAQEARYELLLFIDSHMSVANSHFLAHYLSHADYPLAYGGYTIAKNSKYKGNLRYAYEISCIDAQDADKRASSPYANFHTSNFMIHRDVMLSHPLDERFKHYGYEDVLFGKQLQAAGIKIVHIDNPIGFQRFESNSRFVEKTEESLRTLHQFKDELRGYSRLLSLTDRFHRYHLSGILRLFHTCLGTTLRKNLTNNNPSLFLFRLYKLTYFSSLGA